MKRFIALILCAATLTCLLAGTASAAGTSSDPLVTRVYLEGAYKTALIQDATGTVLTTYSTAYDNAYARLQSAHVRYMSALGINKTYRFTPGYTRLSLPSGSTAELLTGSSFVLSSGSASVTVAKGTVINVTTGTVVTSGSALTANQRYFCAEETTAVFTASSSAVCMVDGFYSSSVAPQTQVFKDVRESDWFYEAVNFVYNRGLFKGTTEDMFSPGASMTRGMFVTVLYRFAGSPSIAVSPAFSDVSDASMYYYTPVFWANTNGIVTGYQSGLFGPDNSVTREQMAVIMYRYASFAGYNVTGGNTDAINAFPDVGQISPGMEDAMRWATANGIINGSDGKLLPTGTATRAQVAQIIMNFAKKYA